MINSLMIGQALINSVIFIYKDILIHKIKKLYFKNKVLIK
jgi:hypothetical protein